MVHAAVYNLTIRVLVFLVCGLSVTSGPLRVYDQLTHEIYYEYIGRARDSFDLLGILLGYKKRSNVSKDQPALSRPTSDKAWKTVLLWGTWFGASWSKRFGPHSPQGLREAGCPEWHCKFTLGRSRTDIADAIVFTAEEFGDVKSQEYPRPDHQRWVWVNVEAPQAKEPKNKEATFWDPSFLVNWTMTYHSKADVVAFYGYFTALNSTQMPLTPNKMSEFPETMRKCKEDLAAGITLSDIMGRDWKIIMNKTKTVAWMSSHCQTDSRREDYIQELSRHITVDTYGKCGRETCTFRNPFGNDTCWTETLSQYSFYMSMENKFCNEYITEKVYLPMENYIVPVVWGGADYSQFLPPTSYIDARRYHPKDLARLLVHLHNNPVEYARYHLWRRYWKVHRGGSFCQLCHRLHTDNKEKHYYDIGNFRLKNGMCFKAPNDIFNRQRRPEYWQKFLEKYNSTML